MGMKSSMFISDHGIIQYLKDNLENRGYNVWHFDHPFFAIENIRKGIVPDLIISDVHKHSTADGSPENYNGLDFAREAHEELGDRTRIILWSGSIHYRENVPKTGS